MNQKKTTPDEQFVCKLYELASARGDPFQRVASILVAKAIGLKEKGIKNTVKLLAQANFIRKVDDESICLTEQGKAFAIQSKEN